MLTIILIAYAIACYAIFIAAFWNDVSDPTMSWLDHLYVIAVILAAPISLPVIVALFFGSIALFYVIDKGDDE